MMFDAHAHWLPGEIIEQAHFYSPAWGNIETQLKLMDECGIDKTLIVYPTNDAHTKLGGPAAVARIYNERLAEVVARYPQRLVGAAILPVDNPRAMTEEFEHATKSLGFGALSLGTSFDGVYLDDEGFFELYAAAEAGGIPLFIHPQTINPIGYERLKHPLLTPVIEFVFDTTVCIGKLITSGVLTKFPDLKFVFAHFGGVMPFIKERFDSVYKMLRGRNIVPDLGALPASYLKQLYVDTSGITSKHALMCTIEMVGAEHVLWGSDYPGNPDIPASVSAIAELDISPEEKAGILNDNVRRLLPPTL
jgi:predicted TIM-barrel fold metal-dependent hydrolase